MTTPTPILTLESARRSVGERSFCGTGTQDRVGVELEWHTTPSDDPPDVATLRAMLASVDPLPHRSRISFEPGGQIELSSRPLANWADACGAVSSDTRVVARRLRDEGVELFATGIDAARSRELRTDGPRYVAMREYFDHYGPAGGRMMCATAAIHLNLDAGADDEGRERWRAAHAIGPTLVAAFANSPFADGAPSGWKSSRFDTWRALDPSRTRPVDAEEDPPQAWAKYALDAKVMFIRTGERYQPLVEPLTMREWILRGHRAGYPDPGDLAYHLTTLFPPVRPRGWLELRMIDMLPDPWWRVAVAVASTLVCDRAARSRALAACTGTEQMWDLAARCALEDPALHRSARACFDAAIDSLDGQAEEVRDYAERFIARGRTPADEALDQLQSTAIAEAL